MIREELQRLDAVEAELAAASGPQREALVSGVFLALACGAILSLMDVRLSVIQVSQTFGTWRRRRRSWREIM